jgi:hypothetical protein
MDEVQLPISHIHSLLDDVPLLAYESLLTNLAIECIDIHS